MRSLPPRDREAEAGRPAPAAELSADPGAAVAADVAPDAGERVTATQMRRGQVRGSSLLVLGRVLTLLITTATQVVLVRALTMSDFGAFAYALALAGAMQLLLSLGQGKLLSRFMAKYEEERDYDRMFGSMFLAVGTILLTSTIAVVTLFLLPDEVISSAVQDPSTVPVVYILLFLAPLEALDQVFVALFAVFSKPRTIFFRKYLLTPGLRFAIVLTLALTGASVTFLALGYLAAGLIGLLVYVTVFVRVLRERDLLRHLRVRRIILPYRAVFAFSLPMITGELFVLSMSYGGVFILGYYHAAAEVASYRAVFSPARLNHAVVHAFVPLFLPLAARLYARRDIGELRRSYWQATAFVAVLTFPLFALTGPLAPTLTVLLFGERYADSALVLALLSVGYYISAVLGFNTYTLQVAERIRFLVGVNLFVAVLNVALSLALVQRYAAVGVAIANLGALVAQNLINQWVLRGAIKTAFIDRSCLRCYLVIAACTAALWAFQVLFEPGVVLSLTSAALASVVVLLASRNAIELRDTFPELTRVPVVRWLVR